MWPTPISRIWRGHRSPGEIGPWANYAFGEKTYLALSLAAKSLLPWQVFLVSLIE
ncbi:hypothetical protein [Pseudarthrobacter defluvii]|uniref:hypothetical protein n=1 Tax=Pseudarthrobacter defluvii TaxID=410837 RepID=UPI0027D8AD47|nr:hypothetical protein [Pseudarthrobacter defluvii]